MLSDRSIERTHKLWILLSPNVCRSDKITMEIELEKVNALLSLMVTLNMNGLSVFRKCSWNYSRVMAKCADQWQIELRPVMAVRWVVIERHLRSERHFRQAITLTRVNELRTCNSLRICLYRTFDTIARFQLNITFIAVYIFVECINSNEQIGLDFHCNSLFAYLFGYLGFYFPFHKYFIG